MSPLNIGTGMPKHSAFSTNISRKKIMMEAVLNVIVR